jgi:peroxin-1
LTFSNIVLGHTLLKKHLGISLSSGLLISGGLGIGKSALTRKLVRQLATGPFSPCMKTFCISWLGPIWLNCKDLVRLSNSKVIELLTSAFKQAHMKSPSIIVFDDLDKLIPAEKEVTKHMLD